MTFKVNFNSQLKFNNDLILILLDESLKLRGNIALLDKNCGGIISEALKLKTLNNKGSIKSIYLKKDKGIREILLYNIGNEKNINIDNAERIGGSIFSSIPKSCKKLTIYFEIDKKSKITLEELAAKITHGIKLRSYSFYKYKLKSKDKFDTLLKEVEFKVNSVALAKKYYIPLKALEEGVFLTRNLVSEPANILTPENLAKEAEKLKILGVKVEVLKLPQIKKLKMGALLGVAMGSANEPRVVSMSWN